MRYVIVEDEVREMELYYLALQGKQHDMEIMNQFEDEMVDFDMGSADLGSIMELKARIHQLENENRVQKAMKLWVLFFFVFVFFANFVQLCFSNSSFFLLFICQIIVDRKKL